VHGHSCAGAGANTTTDNASHDGSLPYEERGRGAPVLLIPGTGFGTASWGEFGELLAARRRVISYERRGFTPAAPEPAADMRVHAADACSVLERAGALPADVVGWSGGGLVALTLAIEHPGACRSLLLVEPSVHGLRAVTLSAVGMTLRARVAKLRGGQRAATDLAYRWTFAYRGLGRNAWEEMPDEWRERVLSRADAVAAEQDEEVSLRYPSRRDLAKLDLSVEIVVGELGQPYFHRIARHLERLIPSAAVHSVPGASHAVHLDAPDAVAALIE
jgi:pimeloyl-ACP methyl ester carboxylesterase